MKRLVPLLALICTVNLYSQTERIQIPWSLNGNNLSFKGAFFEDQNTRLPLFTKIVEWPSIESKPEINITIHSSRLLSNSNLSHDIEEIVQSDPNIEYSIASAKGRRYLQIKISPFFRNESGRIERIETFDFHIKKEFGNSNVIAQDHPDWKSNSVLSSGSWYKIAVEQGGMHKLSYDQLLDIGISSPENIRIYGSGARILRERFSLGHIDDLESIPIHMQMGGDDSFGPGDYVLFYAHGPVEWNYSGEDQYFHHNLHDYSWKGYYFLTDSKGSSLPIEKKDGTNLEPSHSITTYDFRDYFEEEKYNLISSGKEWYGDNFNVNLEGIYPFLLPDRVPDESVGIYVKAAIRSNVTSSFTIKANNNPLGLISANGTDLSYYVATYAYEAEGRFSFMPTQENLTVSLVYERPNSNSEGWMNFITINGRSNLRMNGNQLDFRDSRSVGQGNIGQFSIANANNNMLIWDVTSPGNPMQISYLLNGSIAKFIIPTDSIREFVAFNTEGEFPSPLYNTEDLGPVKNQNLHGLKHPDLVIITTEELLEQAQRLSEHRMTNDGIESAVVLQQEVFNEFSSGTPDAVSIRNFMKMFYDRSKSTEEYCRYLLLLGDGTYDNRNYSEENTNLILTYQSDNSLSPTRSYVSDDFFGLLDTDESMYNGLLDIGIGRLPVSSIEEAEIVINKIISYNDPAAAGTWRNEICFIGDDEDGNLHMRQADQLATKVGDLHPGFKINKIYLDAYNQVEGATGYRYPDVNRAINDQINRGALIVNYTGHGGPTGLALEQILTMNDIFSWTNISALPLIMTATCEFSRYDEYDSKQDQEITSAGEEVLLSPTGGSAGLFTTTRLVYAGPNFVLNEKFYDIVFSKDENQENYRLGDIIAYSKNNTGAGINKRNFSLLGDPSMKLAMPEHIVVTDSINGHVANISTDTLSAFDRVSVSGHFETAEGQLLESFTGSVFPIVYDKSTQIQILANDKGAPWNFTSRSNVLYKGEISVVNGRFIYDFFIPKDINYAVGEGKIIYYGTDQKVDGHGSFENFKVGGIGSENALDTQPPRIDVFMNDTFFVSGGITNRNPELLVLIKDNYGINTSGNGIGHDLTATLDGDRLNAVVLNELYTANLGSYNSGIIQYSYENLDIGRHEINVKIWDIHNNSTESSIEFIVTDSEQFLITNLFNYPNPLRDKTWFSIEQNLIDEPLTIKLRIFDMSGRLMNYLEKGIIPSGNRLEPIEWDGRSSGGYPLEEGIYLYMVEIATDYGETAHSSGKLIISK